MPFQPAPMPTRVLLCVAAPAEARAVLAALGAPALLADQAWRLHRLEAAIDLVVTGVGKSGAAGAVARLLDPPRHPIVLSIGVCGSLPGAAGTAGLPIGAIVAAAASVFADEGVAADTGFTDMARLGFPPAPGLGAAVPAHPEVLAALRPLADAIGPIATVSTCSGTDALAIEIARRTDGVAEAMEGAAVGLVAHRLGVRFGELRVVSNTTGSRTSQRWDLPGALARLSDVVSRLPRALGLRAGASGEL